MTESSFGWDGTTVGDATIAEYNSKEFFEDWFKFTLQYDGDMGVIDTGWSGFTGGLQVNAGSGVVTVQTGVALVNGRMYKNDAALTLTPDDTPTSRVDRIILRNDPVAQTIRAVVLKGTNGSGTPPALTQTPGGVWEISLATVAITPGPTIGTVTSTIQAVRTPLGPGYQFDKQTGNVVGGWLAASWQVIDTGVKISLGPGKWIIGATLGFSAGNTTDIRGVRIVNNTSGSTVLCSGRQTAANGEQRTITTPQTPVTLTAINELEVQFLAGNANDTVLGDAGSNGNMTSIVAIRVV